MQADIYIVVTAQPTWWFVCRHYAMYFAVNWYYYTSNWNLICLMTYLRYLKES